MVRLDAAALVLLIAALPLSAAKVIIDVVSPLQGPDDACADECRCNVNSTLRYNLTCVFMRLNPDIEVRYRKADWGTLFSAVEEAAFSTDASERADIVYVGSTWMLDLVKRGVIRNLQPFLNDLRLTRPRGDLTLEFARQCETDFKINGDYWAIPDSLNSRTLFYRQDLYKKYLNRTGPPETLQEMWDNGLLIQEGERKEGKTVWGYVTELEHNILQHFTPFYLGFGGSLLDRVGQCGFHTAEFKGAVGMLNEMYNSARKVMPSEITSLGRAQEIFNAGNASHLISGGWNWWGFKDLNFTGPEPSIQVAQTPAGPKGRFAFLGANAWAITSTSPRVAEAWKFLQYLTDPDGTHLELIEENGEISPYQRLWKHASDMVHVKAQIDQLPYSFSQYFPTTDNFWMPRLETNGTVGRMVRRVLLGQMGIDRAAEVACMEMTELFCCEPVPVALVRTEFPLYAILLLVIVGCIALVAFGMWYWKRGQANDLYSDIQVAERCAESIAAMKLEEVRYILDIKNPNRIQKAFIRIIQILHEYRRFIPQSVWLAFDDDFEVTFDRQGFSSSMEDVQAARLSPMLPVVLGSPQVTFDGDKSILKSLDGSVRLGRRQQTEETSSPPVSPAKSTQSSKFSTPPGTPEAKRVLKHSGSSNQLKRMQMGQERRKIAISVINLIGSLGVESEVKRRDRLRVLVSNCLLETMQRKGVLDGVVGDRARCSWNASRPCVRCRVHSLVSTVEITNAAGAHDFAQMSAAVTGGEALCGSEGALDFRYYLVDGPKVSFAFVLERLAAREAMEISSGTGVHASVTLCDASVKSDTTGELMHRWWGMLSFHKLGPRPCGLWHAVACYPRDREGKEWMYELAGRQEIWDVYNVAAKSARPTEDTLVPLLDCIAKLRDPTMAEYYTEKLRTHITNKTRPAPSSLSDVGLQEKVIELDGGTPVDEAEESPMSTQHGRERTGSPELL